MQTIDDAIERLAQSITQSPAFLAYVKAKKNITETPSHLDAVNKYKKLLILQEVRRMNGDTLTEADDKALSELYSRLALHPQCLHFLNCEREMANITEKILNRLEQISPVDLEILHSLV